MFFSLSILYYIRNFIRKNASILIFTLWYLYCTLYSFLHQTKNLFFSKEDCHQHRLACLLVFPNYRYFIKTKMKFLFVNFMFFITFLCSFDSPCMYIIKKSLLLSRSAATPVLTFLSFFVFLFLLPLI